MGHQHEASGGKRFGYITQFLLFGVRLDRDTIFDTSAFNGMLCLVCVIIVRSLFGVSLNGTGGRSWGRQNREYRSLDLTRTASTRNQIFYLRKLIAASVDPSIISSEINSSQREIANEVRNKTLVFIGLMGTSLASYLSIIIKYVDIILIVGLPIIAIIALALIVPWVIRIVLRKKHE